MPKIILIIDKSLEFFIKKKRMKIWKRILKNENEVEEDSHKECLKIVEI